MARLPRNQLLDLLFQLFREQPRWSFKPLRERTQQPEVYLKEVLNEIAVLHRSGEHNGMWELSEIFAREGVSAVHIISSFLRLLIHHCRSRQRTFLVQVLGGRVMWQWRIMMRMTTRTRTIWRRFHNFINSTT